MVETCAGLPKAGATQAAPETKPLIEQLKELQDIFWSVRDLLEGTVRLTAEIRWFWPGLPRADFHAWFISAGPTWRAAGDCKIRIDEYLRDNDQVALGIKKRGGGNVEIKGLFSERSTLLELAGATSAVGLWAKWSSTLVLDPANLIRLEKQRWMRKFAVGGGAVSDCAPSSDDMLRPSGCDVELTRLEGRDGMPWWTLGFEAFGALDEVEEELAATVAVLGQRSPPPLPAGQATGYPGWLAARRW